MVPERDHFFCDLEELTIILITIITKLYILFCLTCFLLRQTSLNHSCTMLTTRLLYWKITTEFIMLELPTNITSENPMQSTSTQSPSSPSLVNTVRQKNRSIAEWFDENRCVGSENMQKEFQKTTFRDNDGVLRCMDSWLPAPDDGYPYLLPGSYELYLSSLKTLSITAGASSNASVKILCD